MEQPKDCVDALGGRAQLIVQFAIEFQARECRGGEYVVWVECFASNGDTVQLHYDDGVPYSDTHPAIICRPEDIRSVRKV